jgi:Zn-dependent protease
MFSNLSGGDIVIFLVSLIIGLTLHELMHGLVAHALGDDTAHREGRLTLNPLAHIDTVMTILLPLVLILIGAPPILAAKPVPFNPDRLKFDEFGAALVGIAGPVTNLVLAALAASLLRFGVVDFSSVAGNALIIFTSLNIGLFVFNMIPFPPLDGSRVLYAFAPEPVRRVMEQIEAYGFLLLLFVILFAYQFIAGPIGNIMEAILRFLLI